MELPLVECLADMEYDGVLVDAERLGQMSLELQKDMTEVEKKIFELAGEPVNINSPKQLSKILFEKLKLPVIKKTKTGISTDESVLLKLASEHEICRWIVNSASSPSFALRTSKRCSSRLTGTRAGSIPITIKRSPRPGVSRARIPICRTSHFERREVRYSFGFRGATRHGVARGRLFPNRAAVTRRDEPGSGARAGVRGRGGCSRVYGKAHFRKRQITPDQRRVAKTINFGVVYGQSPSASRKC